LLKAAIAIFILLAVIPASLHARSKARLYDLKTGEVFTAEFTRKW